MLRTLAGALALVFASAAGAAAAEYKVAEGSKITYHVTHSMHEVFGVSLSPRGAVNYDVANPTDFSGLIGKPIQVDWVSFDSGNANRDANARAVAGAEKFPTVTLVIESLTGTLNGKTVEGTMQGRLYINGKRKPVSAPVQVDLSDPEAVKVAAHFTVKMTAFGIEPPSLLFIAVNDDVAVDVALILRK